MRTTTRLAVLAAAAAAPLLVTAPADAGGGCHRSAGEQSESTGTSVDMVHMCMEPTILHADVDTEVTFVNDDTVAHNAYGVGWSTALLEPGSSDTVRFDSPGTYPYACSLHPGMVGAVVVGERAAAVTEPLSAEPAAASSGLPLAPAAGAVVVAALAVGALAARRGRSAGEDA